MHNLSTTSSQEFKGRGWSELSATRTEVGVAGPADDHTSGASSRSYFCQTTPLEGVCP